MAKINFPSVIKPAFAAHVSEVRTFLTYIMTWAGNRADKKAELTAQMVATGLVAGVPTDTDQLISNGEVVLGVTVTGTGTTATFTVAGGKITAIALA